MLKNITGLLIITTALELTGCASNASVDQMVYKSNTSEKPQKVTLVNNIAVSTVTGGTETNPLWISKINDANFKSALEQSLQQANLYHVINGEKYQLQANLLKVEQPFIGLNFKVVCYAHYKLKDKKSNKVIFDKDITSSYTATFNDSPIGMVRLKIANEGAARENFQKLIKELYHL